MEKQFPEFSAVLFDMDGVIFDTEKVVVACWQEVAKKYGILSHCRIHAESASD